LGACARRRATSGAGNWQVCECVCERVWGNIRRMK
jgi:hypothetical protein